MGLRKQFDKVKVRDSRVQDTNEFIRESAEWAEEKVRE